MGFKEFTVRKEAAGGFGKSMLEIGTALSKGLEKVGPDTLMKIMGYGLPAMAALELINLEPTGDVIGEYLKNKMVPGMDEANRAREMELSATMEMGAKHLPALSADAIGYESGRDRKKQDVQRAMGQVDTLVNSMKNDTVLPDNIDESKLRNLVTEMINIAPVSTLENPTIVISLLRAAVLMGSDTIDLQTAQQLASLEQSYTGRR